MEIQDFVENTYMGNFKEWDGKIIWKGKETLVRLTIYKECDNVELEKEKMQEKVESPLPTMKLEPTITESKPIRRTRQRQHDDDFEL